MLVPEPWVTVCVALYNRAAWVTEALASVQAQSDAGWLLLVADDGSTDDGPARVAALEDGRIGLLHKPHSGCWDTKNHLVNAVTTPWLLFLDSHDLLRPDCLSRARAVLRENDEYVYPTAVEIVREDLSSTGNIWRYVAWPRREDLLRLFWERGVNGIPHAGAFIRRELFRRTGLFDASLANHADMLFTIQNALKVKWRLDTGVRGYVNRQHAAQTNRISPGRAAAQASALTWMMEHAAPEHYLTNPPSDERDLLQLWTDTLMRHAAEAGEVGEPFRKAALPYLRRLRELHA